MHKEQTSLHQGTGMEAATPTARPTHNSKDSYNSYNSYINTQVHRSGTHIRPDSYTLREHGSSGTDTTTTDNVISKTGTRVSVVERADTPRGRT